MQVPLYKSFRGIGKQQFSVDDRAFFKSQVVMGRGWYYNI